MSPKLTGAALRVKQEGYEDESADCHECINQSKIWNSVEVYTLYVDKGNRNM